MSLFDDIITALGSTAANLLTIVNPTAVPTYNAATDAAAAGMAIQTTQINQQNFTISTQTTGYRNPTWVARYPIADVSYPEALNLFGLTTGNTAAASAGTAHTHTLDTHGISGPQALGQVVNLCYGAYITVGTTTVMDTVAAYVFKASGSLNNIVLDVFRENSDLSLTRLSTTDISTLMGTTLPTCYLEVPLNSNIIAQAGERYMVRISNLTTLTGVLGTVCIAKDSNLSPNIAFTTTTSTTTAQTSYSTSDTAAAKAASTYVPWAMLASKSSILPTDQSFSDDFNRTTFGGQWALSHTAGTADVGIVSNKAAYGGTTDGAQHGLYIRACTSNANRVDCDITNTAAATTGARCGPFLNANQNFSQMVYLGVSNSAATIYSGSFASPTSRATVSMTGNDGTWTLYYDVTLNKYQALLNGVDIGLSWTDSGSLMTHAPFYRLGGIRIERLTSVNAGNVDNWTLRDYTP